MKAAQPAPDRDGFRDRIVALRRESDRRRRMHALRTVLLAVIALLWLLLLAVPVFGG